MTCIQKVGGSNPPSSTHSTIPACHLLQLIEGFLLTCRVERKSPKTIIYYKGILDRFVWYLGENGVTNIDTAVIRSFLGYVQSVEHRWGSNNSRAKRKASQVTVQRYYVGLKVFFNWCLREVYTESSPLSTIKKPKASKKIVKAILTEDINRLFKSINGKDFYSLRNKAILILVFDTGLRLAEIASLKMSDIRNDMVVVMGKGSKQRIARIGTITQKAVWHYLIARQHVTSLNDALWTTSKGLPLSAGGIQQMIVKLGKRLGIKLSPHKLRHTFALHYLRNGGDVFTLQTLLGHSTLEIVKSYLGSLTIDDAIESHKRFSPADNLKTQRY